MSGIRPAAGKTVPLLSLRRPEVSFYLELPIFCFPTRLCISVILLQLFWLIYFCLLAASLIGNQYSFELIFAPLVPARPLHRHIRAWSTTSNLSFSQYSKLQSTRPRCRQCNGIRSRGDPAKYGNWPPSPECHNLQQYRRLQQWWHHMLSSLNPMYLDSADRPSVCSILFLCPLTAGRGQEANLLAVCT